MKDKQKRKSGLLLPIFALPNNFGIGDLGPGAARFIDLLAAGGFKVWQVLPVTPVDAVYSPYQGESAFAGNPFLINPEGLCDAGLLTAQECQAAKYPGDPGRVAYDFISEQRLELLRLAFSRVDSEMQKRIDRYVEREAYWLTDYAIFQAGRQMFAPEPWWQWHDHKLRLAERTRIEEIIQRQDSAVGFQYFLAFEFDRQWHILQEKAAARGVELWGDLPIYVARDSADVWSHRHLFNLADDLSPAELSGVPPDYFSPEGQLWGHPLYDWQALKESGYDWWIKRIERALSLFDRVRIDHFRGLYAYWAVPATAGSAKERSWRPGPGLDLIRQITARFSKNRIFAEDLGDIDDHVRHFLHQSGLAGMKVLQFSFDLAGQDKDRPHSYPADCVAYSGTHDNTTLSGWLAGLSHQQKELLKNYCGGLERTAILRALWQTAARTVIIPAQECLGLSGADRINTPGTSGGDNWRFRLTLKQIEQIDTDYFARLNLSFGR